jgi:predicted nuclease with TOPRIM domain
LNNQNATNITNSSNLNTSNNVLLTSPFKNKIISNHKHTNSKPIEEILKNTLKLMEEKKEENSEKENDKERLKDSEKIICNIQEINSQLKNVKSRTHKLLNMYSEMVTKKSKNYNTQPSSNTFTSLNTNANTNSNY